MLDAFPFFADVVSYWPQIVRGLRDTILLSVTITATGLVGGIVVFGLTLSSKPIGPLRSRRATFPCSSGRR